MIPRLLEETALRKVVIRVFCRQAARPFRGDSFYVTVDLVSFYRNNHGVPFCGRVTFDVFPQRVGGFIHYAFDLPEQLTPEWFESVSRRWADTPVLRDSNLGEAAAVLFHEVGDVEEIKVGSLFVQLLLARCVGILYKIAKDGQSDLLQVAFARALSVRLESFIRSQCQQWSELGAFF